MKINTTTPNYKGYRFPVLATWDIRSGNRLLWTRERAFLPMHVRYAYNQHGPFCVCAPTVRHFHKEEVLFVLCMLSSIKQCISFCVHALQEHVLRWIKPPTISFVLDTLVDLTRGKSELLAENALLRQQLIILRRQVKRPTYRKTDRLLLVLLARMVRTWKQALFLVQPETLLRWHRELFRLFTEAQVKGVREKTKAFARDDCLD